MKSGSRVKHLCLLMEDENRNETSLRHDDGLLYERDINEGDFVTMDGQHQLWKL